MNVYKNVLSIS